MKLTAIIIICLLWVSCKKEPASGNQLSGTYKGDMLYSPSTLASQDEVSLTDGSSAGTLIIKEKVNGLTLTATITGDSIIIPDQNVTISPGTPGGTVLYGSGIIVGDTLGITLTRKASPNVGIFSMSFGGIKQ